MKIAIAGKGGVGKTTLAALICWVFKETGQEVLAVDADPDTNLAEVLGFPQSKNIIPIIQMKELIAERMEIEPGNRSLFKLNPKIDDIPDKFIQEYDGIRLIVMGAVEIGGSGCVCPENTFLKRLLRQIVLTKDEHIVVDFEAGLEHLGRGTAAKFDHLIVVVEVSTLSLDTLQRILPLAKDIGIKQISCVANRIKDKAELDFIHSHLDKINPAPSYPKPTLPYRRGGVKLLGSLSYSAACLEVSRKGNWLALKKDKIYQETKELVKTLSGSFAK